MSKNNSSQGLAVNMDGEIEDKIMFCPNCGAKIASTSMQPNQIFTDQSGKKYKTVKICNQIWMAENLDYDTGNSGACVYHKDNPNNQKGYGRLYTWEEAKNSCPIGWHLPSKEEWQALVNFAGDDKAGTALKAENGWNFSGNGTDEFGFSALPGGFGKSDGSFDDAGNRGYWWCSSKYSDCNTLYMVHSREDVFDEDYNEGRFLSVRYVQN